MVAHLKAGTASHGWVSVRVSNGNIAYAMIDFSAGTSTHGSYGSVTNPSSTVTALGSDWYRLTLTATVSSPLLLAFMGISDGTAVQSDGYETGWNSTGQTMYAWGIQLSSTNSKVYDSPTTTQISRSYSPLLKTASADSPRFEYAADGQSVGTALGLLVESQATNLTKYSDDFSSWGDTSTVAVTSNAGVAPNGQLAADLLVSPSSASAHYILDSTIAFTSGTTYTASVYVKSAGHRYVQLCGTTSAFGISPYQWVNYDLEAGTLNANNCSGTITAVGNGYYRITATMAATATSTQSFILMFADSLSSGFFPTTTGDDYSGFLAYGFQTELGSSASSVISTNGSQVSRASDSCSVATADFGFTGGPVSVFTDAAAGAGSYPCIFALNKGDSANDSVRLFRDLPSSTLTTNFRYFVKDGGTNSVEKTVAGSGSVSKFAVRSDTNNSAIKPSGLTQFSDTTCTTPAIDTLEIGGGPGIGQLNGTIRNLMLWNVALSDTELAALVD
jgi:hypothetical protein